MDDDPNDMMTVDSHHALGDIFAESSDNVIDFAADNDIIHNEDLLLRDSAFSKFSLDSKLSTELAQMFDDEDEAPQDHEHGGANGDLQFSTFLDDTANRNMNLMMMVIGTKIIVPTNYDDGISRRTYLGTYLGRYLSTTRMRSTSWPLLLHFRGGNDQLGDEYTERGICLEFSERYQ